MTEKKSLVVTTAEDIVDAYDGVISLREALNYAKDGTTDDEGKYTITFDESLSGKTILLNSTLQYGNNFTSVENTLTINGDIDGNGTADITLDGGGSIEQISVSGNDYSILKGLIFKNGKERNGGALGVNGYMIVSNCVFSNNSAGDGGGAVAKNQK